MTAPTIKDMKPFVPAKDFELSLRYYQALGATVNWQHDGLAEIDFGPSRIMLQDYYQKNWAENFVMHIPVDDATAWHTHIAAMVASGDYGEIRVSEPKAEPWCRLVTYAWDPAGVLLNLAQFE